MNDLIHLSEGELSEKEKSLKEQLYKLNYQRYSGRVENPHLFRLLKTDIARIKTILQERMNKKAK